MFEKPTKSGGHPSSRTRSQAKEVKEESIFKRLKRKRLFRIVAFLTIFGIIYSITSLFTGDKKETAPVNEDLNSETAVVVNTEGEDSEKLAEEVYGDSSDETSTSDETLSDDDSSEEEVIVIDKKEKPLQNNFVWYENGLLSVKLAIPSTYYTEELSQSGYDVLKDSMKDGKFDLLKQELKGVVPIVNITSFDNDPTTINVVAYGKSVASKVEVGKGVYLDGEVVDGLDGNLTAKKQKVATFSKEGVKDAKKKTERSYKTYKYKSLGETYTGTQISVNVGKNIVVFNVTGKNSEDYKVTMGYLEQIAQSISEFK